MVFVLNFSSIYNRMDNKFDLSKDNYHVTCVQQQQEFIYNPRHTLSWLQPTVEPWIIDDKLYM
jgi:hypothetical protein